MKKIKVAFDYQIFVRQKFGGISRVFFEVNNRIGQMEGIELKYPLLFSQNFYFKDILHTSELATKSKFINYLIRVFNKIFFICYLLLDRDCDIVHGTYYASYFYHFLPARTHYVLTVHDCTQELCSKNTFGNRRMKKLKEKAIRRADTIIVPSNNTKKDIVELYHIEADKIKVIYWGFDKKEIDYKNIKIEIPSKYILYVGARNDYKNFERFVNVYKRVSDKIDDLQLICVGGKFLDYENNMITQLQLADKIVQIQANDDELLYLYANAICFVYPSLYEGFGIPILEAFGQNCPVLLSNRSCFPEIGGDAVAYFEPTDSEDMETVILSYVMNEKMREKLMETGKKRCELFSWDETANQIYGEYMGLSNE